jgi:WD40 repeat protein
MTFSNNGQFLVTQSLPTSLVGSLILVWNLENREIEATFEVEDESNIDVLFSPDDKMLVGFGGNGFLRVWSFPDLESLWDQSYMHMSHLQPPRFSQDGQMMVTVDEAGNAGLWDLKTGRRLPQRWSVHLTDIIDLSFAPDGRRLASASADNTVAIWATTTGDLEVASDQLASAVSNVSFDMAGNRVAIAASDGSVAIWDLTTNEIDEAVIVQGDAIQVMVFHPTEPWLALALSGSGIRIYDFEDGSLITSLSAGAAANELVWLGDGTELMVVSDQTLDFFDVASGEALTATDNLTADLPQGQSVTWSSSGQTFLIFDKELQLVWGVRNNQAYGPPLNLDSETLLDAQFLSNGNILAVAQNNETGAIHLVTLTYTDWQTAVCLAVNRTFTLSERETYGLNNPTLPREIACN